MKPSRLIFISGLFFLFTATSFADQLIMARTKQSFPEAMLKLQEVIKNYDYQVSRVQRVDIGLTKSGYKTDKYRLVFFGRSNDIQYITANHPELAAYIPWKIAIFAEEQDTILSTVNPIVLTDKKHPGTNKILERWKKDLGKIFSDMRKVDDD